MDACAADSLGDQEDLVDWVKISVELPGAYAALRSGSTTRNRARQFDQLHAPYAVASDVIRSTWIISCGLEVVAAFDG